MPLKTKASYVRIYKVTKLLSACDIYYIATDKREEDIAVQAEQLFLQSHRNFL